MCLCEKQTKQICRRFRLSVYQRFCLSCCSLRPSLRKKKEALHTMPQSSIAISRRANSPSLFVFLSYCTLFLPQKYLLCFVFSAARSVLHFVCPSEIARIFCGPNENSPPSVYNDILPTSTMAAYINNDYSALPLIKNQII